MEFKEYVTLHKNTIYSKICDYIPLKEPSQYYSMIRDYTDRQGKYRRPGLLMLTGQVFGAKVENLILPAAAMQLSEDWILIHDDIEDDSEMRRGKPALHKLHGYEQAINAGDAAHMVMWKIIKDYMEVNPENGSKLYDTFYNMLYKTVEGQYKEIQFSKEANGFKNATEDLYFDIIRGKTCWYSVYGPMQLGAIVAGEKPSTIQKLKEIGEPAGIAFQIMDDILDMTADEKTFGKKRHGDIYEGKLTLIILHAYKSATQTEKDKINNIYSKSRREKTDKDVDFILEMIEKYDGINYAKDLVDEYGKNATNTMHDNLDIFPDNEYKKIFISAVNELFLRKA
ncbi:MAG: polyprenyl synthetase family protein [Candidatus Marsarchaeota archaeon]|jgi:geranylgeranyl diphosphate synthase type II|nr:polyprenyl synthetase family protein [Candidatus Marsarchaeota archaeon]